MALVKKCLLLLGMVLFTQACFAQQKRMLHWGIDEGLSGSTVYCMLQDKQGFMWFGTDQGLCRFDGTNFKTYTVEDGLPDNDVFWMVEDAKGRIWIICFNKNPCYLENGVIHPFHCLSDPEMADMGEFPSAIRTSADGRVFILFSRQLVILNEQLKVLEKYKFYSHAFGLAHMDNHTIVETDDSLFSVSAGKRNLLFNTDYVKTGVEIMYGLDIHQNKLYFVIIKKRTREIVSLNLNNPAGIQSVYSGAGQVFRLNGITDSTLQAVSEDRITLININKPQLSTIFYSPHLLASVIEDKDSNTWIGSIGKGLFMMPKSGVTVYNHSNDAYGSDALSVCGNSIGQIAVGYRLSDLDIIDSSKTVRHITYPDKTNVCRILSIKAKGENFFLGTDHTMMMLDKRLQFTNLLPDRLQGNVKKFDMAPDGKIAIANSESALILTSQYSKTYGEVLFPRRATSVVFVSDSVFAIGSIGGLFFNDHGQISKYDKDATLSSSRISALAVDSKKRVWVSTMQNGVFVVGKNGLAHVSIKNGLSDNSCKNIFCDAADNIWVSTNKGLNKIEPKTDGSFTCLLFDVAYGLPTNEVNDVYVKGDDVWVATAKGLANFKQQNYRHPLLVYLLAFYAHDSLYNLQHPIKLNYLDNDIRIDYVGISYTAGKNMQYKYLLKGTSKADTVFTKAGSIRFAALSPGKYNLFLWAADNNNIWSTTPAQVKFYVSPPFWKTTWFYLLIIVILGGFIALTLAYRVRVVRKKEREKADVTRRMSELEMQALRAQMNPHFIFNALNSIQSFYANNDELAANKFMTTFSALIRQILHSSGKSAISVKDEIALLGNYIELEKMRFKGLFDYKIILDTEIVPEEIFLPILLLQPFVENAINHGIRFIENGKGQLNISFVQKGKLLTCIIEDNGIGLKKSQEKKKTGNAGHISAAMKITHSRIDSLNVIYDNAITINFIDKQQADITNTGVIVIITLPVMKDTMKAI